ncbi:YczI family protein [Peribacillus frigoritolerans]
MPYYMFFLGALILVIGLAELQKDRKVWGYMNIVISLFVFFASIQAFLMN